MWRANELSEHRQLNIPSAQNLQDVRPMKIKLAPICARITLRSFAEARIALRVITLQTFAEARMALRVMNYQKFVNWTFRILKSSKCPSDEKIKLAPARARITLQSFAKARIALRVISEVRELIQHSHRSSKNPSSPVLLWASEYGGIFALRATFLQNISFFLFVLFLFSLFSYVFFLLTNK